MWAVCRIVQRGVPTRIPARDLFVSERSITYARPHWLTRISVHSGAGLWRIDIVGVQETDIDSLEWLPTKVPADRKDVDGRRSGIRRRSHGEVDARVRPSVCL
jgi:hypothetical protein